MNDDFDFGPDDREILDRLRASAPRPRAAARARTREAFLGAPRRRRHGRPAVAAAVAVAIAASLVLIVGFQPDGEWTLRDVNGPVQISRDGQTVSAVLGAEFAPGFVETGDSTEVELAWGDLILRLRPGTRAELPPPPGRWFGRQRHLVVHAGEAFGSSGDAGPGFDLRLRTDQAEARLLGTTFAVFRTDEATCFCLYRGGLEVTPTDGETIALPVEHRVFVYDDGRPPHVEPIDAGERMKLRMIDDAARQR